MLMIFEIILCYLEVSNERPEKSTPGPEKSMPNGTRTLTSAILVELSDQLGAGHDYVGL